MGGHIYAICYSSITKVRTFYTSQRKTFTTQIDTKTYGQRVHLNPREETSDPLSPKEANHIQSIVVLFLYYKRAVDNTIHTALNNIATTSITHHED